MSEALVLGAQRIELDAFQQTCEHFIHAVGCLRLSLDACDEWHRDPDSPDRYTLDPRSDEVTVVYQEAVPVSEEKVALVKKRATLKALLERTGTDWLTVSTKQADPRKLLVDVCNSLDGKLNTFLRAYEANQAKAAESAAAAVAATSQEADLSALLSPELLAECLEGLIEPALAREVALYQSAQLVKRLMEGGGG